MKIGGESIEELRVQSFLKLGYFIDFTEDLQPIDFSRIDKARYVATPREQLIALGAEMLKQSFAQLFEAGRDHVVPLSGGLDSRLVLGCLLQLMPAANIRTYTFGVPGSYDYEIGNLVAKHVGTRHIALPLDGMTYHRTDLLDFARRSQCQAMLFYHPPVHELERLFAGSVIWSGYVGDAVVGSHLHDPPSATLLDAKRAHIKRRTIVRSARLYNFNDDAFLPFVGDLGMNPEILTFDEQVLFAEAVRKYTAPLVLFEGFDYRTPLINSSWMDFSFSVPNRFRVDEALMIATARYAFPRLFDLPTKNSLGFPLGTAPAVLRTMTLVNKVRKLLHQFAPRHVVYPHIIYNDYNEAIRSSPDLKSIVLESIDALKRRNIAPWIPMDELLRRHMARLRNHGDALILLTSLELVLQARGAASV